MFTKQLKMRQNKLIRYLFAVSLLTAFGCSPGAGTQKNYTHPIPETIDSNVVIPPAWSFGVLYGGYTNQNETIERIKKIQEHNYPIDAYWIDSWFWDYRNEGMGPDKYIDFVADTISYPNRQQMWAFMEKNNIKGGFWIWDCIQKTGNEEAFNDFKKRGFLTDIHINKNSWHNKSTSTAMHQENSEHPGTPTGNIDFDNPEAVAYFKQRMKPFFDEGADFIKLDRTDKISVCRTMFEMSQEFGQETEGRGFILSHSGGTNDPEYKRYPTKWTDDTRSDWTVESPTKSFSSWVPKVALKENIAMYTDTAKRTSDIPFLTNDMGGFDMGKTDELDEELYIRWMQFSFFGPITEVFSQPENPTSNMPWKYSERADTLFRHYSHLRMKLFPYIYSYAHHSRLKSEHMIGKFPDHIYQYMFGDEMLVAPVYEQGATSREVFLPDGKWFNYWNGKEIAGNQTIKTSAPINEIPVFIKKGAIIPMRNYASSVEAGTNDTLHVHVYPGADGDFTLIEDDGISNDYINGIYAKTEMKLVEKDAESVLTIEPVLGHYENMAETRTWVFHIHNAENLSQININGQNTSFTKKEESAVSQPFTNNKYEETRLVITY